MTAQAHVLSWESVGVIVVYVQFIGALSGFLGAVSQPGVATNSAYAGGWGGVLRGCVDGGYLCENTPCRLVFS